MRSFLSSGIVIRYHVFIGDTAIGTATITKNSICKIKWHWSIQRYRAFCAVAVGECKEYNKRNLSPGIDAGLDFSLCNNKACELLNHNKQFSLLTLFIPELRLHYFLFFRLWYSIRSYKVIRGIYDLRITFRYKLDWILFSSKVIILEKINPGDNCARHPKWSVV